MTEKILNLCDIGSRICREHRLEDILKNMPDVSRIYVGSYFCDRYFIMTAMDILDCCIPWCLEKKLKITCVVPIPSQDNLAMVKESVLGLLSRGGGLADTLCVNDPGMLWWAGACPGIKLVLGRLYSKEIRDPRYEQIVIPGVYQVSRETEELIEKFGISGIEAEGIYNAVKKYDSHMDYVIYAHGRHCYMSCGRYCLFASVHKEDAYKFRTNMSCSLECMEFMIKNLLQNHKEVFRIGKGVYYKPEPEKKLPEGAGGLILFPLEDFMGILYADGGNEF